MNPDITSLTELNTILEDFIHYTFEDIIQHGTGERHSCIQKDKYLYKPMYTFIYHVVLETIDCDKITYETMKIRTIYLQVRRQMLEFIKHVMCIEDQDHSVLGTVEEKLLGYYIYAYLHEKLN
jgi:hypothetical protein